MYIINYLNRNNVAAAKQTGKAGLVACLKLKKVEYNFSDAQQDCGYYH